MNVSVVIAYHSGYGHTAAVARAVQIGVERCNGARGELIDVTDLTERHWSLMAEADAIIFGSPTYMGAVSGPFKTFMDQTSSLWLQRRWQDKLAAGFTISSSQAGDKYATLSQLTTLAAQHGMIWVSLGLLPGNNSSTGSIEDINRIGGSLGAMAQANADEPAEITPPDSDRETAALLGARVAELAARFKTGALLGLHSKPGAVPSLEAQN
ncbi:flavodoxin family protein [Wenzhouxiangella marina]|uniref:NADPH-dependent FMN reductase n=1 Tax=Wenzhouxiangella marina TaxID=1579979 RepID=A0A0K0XV51_9GAMM|nr:flavodoxin family protein [Wenzhouxiangella marina]AKS41502.1 NADPH-dependent FMN reductase [Wenzhouxiangella marina]MBB6086739.1 multimeric flavodoxin WrbA [Wenzhouxiangella marina]